MLLKRSALERQVALACRTGHYFLRGRDGRQLGGQYRNFTFSERGTKDCVHFCSYIDLLLKSQRCTMHVSRLRSLSLEIFKTLHDLNPSFMKDIFKLEPQTPNLELEILMILLIISQIKFLSVQTILSLYDLGFGIAYQRH